MFAKEVFALPVLDEDGELCGIVTMSDITKISKAERANVRIAAVFSREVQSAFPDQTVHEVVERMRERYLANFPVVSRRDETRLLGMISKSDVVKAYRRRALEVVT
jgi:CIC family chloride channel protein